MSSSSNDNSQIPSTNSDHLRSPSTSVVNPPYNSSVTSCAVESSHSIKNSSNNIVSSRSGSLVSQIANNDVSEEDFVFLGRNEGTSSRGRGASADSATSDVVNTEENLHGNTEESTHSGQNSVVSENYLACPVHNTENLISNQVQNQTTTLNRRTQSGCNPSNNPVTITPPPVPPCVIQGPPPLPGAPPSYSAVMRLGPLEPEPYRGRPVRMQPSPPFIAPIPPPPYTEYRTQRIDRSLFSASVDQMVWGPDPLSVVCPRCANVVVTATQSQRSNLTHFSALALCLCGCWPCCLLPYCMDSCKNTYHYCPSCQLFLGMYRPW